MTGIDATLSSMQPPTPPIMESARSAPTRLPLTPKWPSPASWTVPSQVYSSRTLILWFQAPELPGVLRPVIEVTPPNLSAVCERLYLICACQRQMTLLLHCLGHVMTRGNYRTCGRVPDACNGLLATGPSIAAIWLS